MARWKDKAMGKSNDPKEDPHAHVSAPLSTLKDPSSFGPPPKHRAYYGDAAGPARPRATNTEEQAARQIKESEANRSPPGPYTADTTGLTTAHLPKPPAFKPGQTTAPTVSQSSKPKPKPNLPPRLPPRQNSHPDEYAPAPPPTYNESTQNNSPSGGYLNQGAMKRLGQAGVGVPGLEIGRNASPPVPPRQPASPSPISPPAVPGRNSSQTNELQSRFANTNTASSFSPTATHSAGTSWADKQAALKTANNLHKDPSQVSLSDARSAASTANNFRERHGEQVAAGWNKASALNQKYNISGRVNSLASGSKASPPPSPTKGGLGKKPPPPPPPKKKELGGSGEPPPIPLGSKPKF
ncbi:hypothetical protein SLS60_008042 [Paraconiothyrium brasiliense]|uniref:Uncharacterized protein n=1 Tax=Paraconiothyrium brasiliense TaxID=300254 RepID=A0ABR3R3E9_9PLEO